MSDGGHHGNIAPKVIIVIVVILVIIAIVIGFNPNLLGWFNPASDG